MKKKLKLNSLKIESFVTALTPDEILQAKGGEEFEGGTTTSIQTRPMSNTLCICVTRSLGCITYLSTCIPSKFETCRPGGLI